MTALFDYDPERPPDSRAWLTLELEERVRLVESYELSVAPKASAVETNPWLYVLVENYIAQGADHVLKAMDRLQTQGLSRHEAVRAIASVVMNWERKSRDEGGELNAAINALSADTWRGSGNAREV
jgi:hypothetical protein